jgi:hypothetical protein
MPPKLAAVIEAIRVPTRAPKRAMATPAAMKIVSRDPPRERVPAAHVVTAISPAPAPKPVPAVSVPALARVPVVRRKDMVKAEVSEVGCADEAALAAE